MTATLTPHNGWQKINEDYSARLIWSDPPGKYWIREHKTGRVFPLHFSLQKFLDKGLTLEFVISPTFNLDLFEARRFLLWAKPSDPPGTLYIESRG